MAIAIPELPFKKKKKEPSVEELKKDIEEKQSALKAKLGEEEKDPIAARLKYFGFNRQESFEKHQHRIVKSEFPEPERRFRLVLEYPNFNVEQTYYWFLSFYNETWGFEKVEKVIDTMAQSVSSSTFGNIQTRIAAQQAQASQYLKGISDMLKGLFQIVREIRVIDERLQFYYDSDGDDKGNSQNALSSEIVLKGLWIDQVEGGAKNPASVYGLAQTIGFTVLPDLFFRFQVKDKNRMEIEVDKLKFNAKVKEVLKRKLRQYYEWKWRTKKELQVRRTFEIKYLRQHYDTIKLYMSWIKPYLRNIRRLQLYEKNMENPHIIKAFETQIIEIETLFIRDDFGDRGNPGHHAAVVSLHFFYRVKPELAYHSFEYQHKGPIYTGMADITLRAYSWSHDDIKRYKEYRQNDDLDLITTIDRSLENAMDSLGDDLKRYLKEAGEDVPFPGDKPQKKEEPAVRPDILDPFLSVFDGFREIIGGFTGGFGGKKASPKKKKKEKPKRSDQLWHHRAVHYAVEAAWEGYLRYKMGPGGNLYWVE